MPSPILARADALMHRRRPGESGPLDDVPVLTDIVDTPLAAPLDEADSALLARLRDRIAERVAAKVLAGLPTLIDSAVAEALAELSATPHDAP